MKDQSDGAENTGECAIWSAGAEVATEVKVLV